MSWIQENKFAAGIAGATLVGSVALLTLTSSKSGEYEENAMRLKNALQEEADLQGATPYPNADNLEAKKVDVADYAASAEKLQKLFDVYRPSAADLTDVSSMEFSKVVAEYESRLNAKFAEADVTAPEGKKYGFDAYANKLPKDAATGELIYQMKAFEWMLSTLADNSPEALLNVVRPQLDVEKGVTKAAPSKSKKKKAKKSRRSKKGKSKKSKSAPKGEPIYDSMPVELAFRCSEAELKTFLEQLSNSDKYFFSVRALRVQNERQNAPNDDDVSFGNKAAGVDTGVDDFGGFIVEEDPADEQPADSPVEASVASDSDDTLALAQILGAEKLNVFLKLDLLVFKPSEESTKKN